MSNDARNVTVIAEGESLGVHRLGGTCVRPTTDGRFAVINYREGGRIIKTFTDPLHARRYNFAIHGDKLDS